MDQNKIDRNIFYSTDSVAYKRENGEIPFQISTPIDVLSSSVRKNPYTYWKRFMDIFWSIVSIVVLLPFLLLISLLIKITSPGRVIFKQKRMGQYGKIFTILKFRTMKENAPSEMATGKFYNANQYITKLGKYLRRTSLDELPQLFNILTGEMSFIGPRPLVLTEAEIHTLRLSKGVYDLKPGITGLAQISGRDLVTPKEKVEYDAKYLDSFSFGTDIRIFFKTIFAVIKHENVLEGSSLHNRYERQSGTSEPRSCHRT